MAGAAPGRTQLLLDRSLRHRYSKSSIICGKGKTVIYSVTLLRSETLSSLIQISSVDRRMH